MLTLLEVNCNKEIKNTYNLCKFLFFSFSYRFIIDYHENEKQKSYAQISSLTKQIM